MITTGYFARKPRARSLLRALALALVTWLLIGCGPALYAVSTPPPTRTARLDVEHPLFAKPRHKVRLSAGVALAVNCSDGGPCHDMRATSDDPAVATVVPAHLNRLEIDYLAHDTTPAATFVVVGVKPGTTTVRVRSKEGNTKIAVTVIE